MKFFTCDMRWKYKNIFLMSFISLQFFICCAIGDEDFDNCFVADPISIPGGNEAELNHRRLKNDECDIGENDEDEEPEKGLAFVSGHRASKTLPIKIEVRKSPLHDATSSKPSPGQLQDQPLCSTCEQAVKEPPFHECLQESLKCLSPEVHEKFLGIITRLRQ